MAPNHKTESHAMETISIDDHENVVQTKNAQIESHLSTITTLRDAVSAAQLNSMNRLYETEWENNIRLRIALQQHQHDHREAQKRITDLETELAGTRSRYEDAAMSRDAVFAAFQKAQAQAEHVQSASPAQGQCDAVARLGAELQKSRDAHAACVAFAASLEEQLARALALLRRVDGFVNEDLIKRASAVVPALEDFLDGFGEGLDGKTLESLEARVEVFQAEEGDGSDGEGTEGDGGSEAEAGADEKGALTLHARKK